MAKGKYAYFICDRSGFRYLYSQRVKEPTGLVVGAPESDGRYNIIDHPQNKTPRIDDDENLKDARPPVVLATTGDAGWSPDDSTFTKRGN
mgnify:FL=1